MKTEVKQYNTAADAVGFLPTQQRGAEGLAVNAALDVKEETRRGKEDKRGVKEGKRKRRAEPCCCDTKSEPKDGMSFVCDPLCILPIY